VPVDPRRPIAWTRPDHFGPALPSPQPGQRLVVRLDPNPQRQRTKQREQRRNPHALQGRITKQLPGVARRKSRQDVDIPPRHANAKCALNRGNPQPAALRPCRPSLLDTKQIITAVGVIHRAFGVAQPRITRQRVAAETFKDLGPLCVTNCHA
jgi:hypothetical protein